MLLQGEVLHCFNMSLHSSKVQWCQFVLVSVCWVALELFNEVPDDVKMSSSSSMVKGNLAMVISNERVTVQLSDEEFLITSSR